MYVYRYVVRGGTTMSRVYLINIFMSSLHTFFIDIKDQLQAKVFTFEQL